MLSTMVDVHHDTCEDHVQSICMSYNTSLQPTTGYSPFFLMFGWKAYHHWTCIWYLRHHYTQSPNEYAAALQKTLGSASEHKCGRTLNLGCADRRISITARSIDSTMSRNMLCFGPLLSQKVSLVSCTTHGWVPIALWSSCLMSPTTFNTPKGGRIIWWFTSTNWNSVWPAHEPGMRNTNHLLLSPIPLLGHPDPTGFWQPPGNHWCWWHGCSLFPKMVPHKSAPSTRLV